VEAPFRQTRGRACRRSPRDLEGPREHDRSRRERPALSSGRITAYDLVVPAEPAVEVLAVVKRYPKSPKNVGVLLAAGVSGFYRRATD
jgi:hypothetical protein